MRRTAGLVLAAIVGAGCGTGSTDVEFDEPVATLFSDDGQVETAEGSSTTAPVVGVDALDPATVPGPVPDAPGVVVLDALAAPVVAVDGAAWTVETPCGGERSGTSPAATTAVVVIDPSGDAATDPEAVVRNTAVAEAIRDRLVAAGVDAITTRSRTTDVAASYRRQVADAAGARVAVSVALPAGTGALGADPGLELVHPAADPDARRLAGLVFAAVAPVLEPYSVGWPDDVEPGVRAVLNQRGGNYFTILQDGSDAARVVLHLPVDPEVAGSVWANDENLAPIGDAVADAIVRHLVTEDEGTGFVAPPEVVRDAVAADPAATCVDPLAVTEDG